MVSGEDSPLCLARPCASFGAHACARTRGARFAAPRQALDVNSSDSDGEDEQSAPSAPPAARPKAAGPAVARKQPVKAKVKAAAGGGGSKKGGSKKS